MSSLAIAGSTGAASSTSVPLAGVNLAGGEFNSAKKPGVYGKDYIYPDSKVATPFIQAGMKMVRVPILWERIQPSANKALNPTELKRLNQSIAQLDGFSIIVIDVHNYGKLRGVRLDRLSNGSAALADLWTRLATHYASKRDIAFGLMNEPNGIPPSRWRTMVDQSVRAIRATGARNLILVPGSAWTGAHSWLSGGNNSNAVAFQNFRDPGGNFAFEMHQYLDTDNSGTHSTCVDSTVAAQRLRPATNWLRQNRYRAYLGEFGAPANSACLRALSGLLTELYRSPDVWMGWSYWAGGGWWGNYPLNLQPSGNTPKPQMAVLKSFLGRTVP
jgi:endoglucanase